MCPLTRLGCSDQDRPEALEDRDWHWQKALGNRDPAPWLASLEKAPSAGGGSGLSAPSPAPGPICSLLAAPGSDRQTKAWSHPPWAVVWIEGLTWGWHAVDSMGGGEDSLGGLAETQTQEV